MLPKTESIEVIDKLVIDFENNKHGRTKTFKIEQGTVNRNEKTSVLGIGKLGVLELNTSLESNTYKIQTDVREVNFISGMIDGRAALEQSIYLMLSIEADHYIIYPYTYGIKTLDLIGKPMYYVMAIIPERIKETLLSDDRITDVTDFEFETAKNKLTVKFLVHSIYGEMEEETEVIY